MEAGRKPGTGRNIRPRRRLYYHPEANGAQRYISLLGQADAAAQQGERGMALALVRKALALEQGVAQPWLETGRDLLARWSKPNNNASLRMDEVVNLEAVAGPVDAEAGLTIDIDTSNYVLTLLDHGEAVEQFPVGLGRNGSTPLGHFRIANNITDPDWYNRGVVVPAGAPNNPLGQRWMGLGRGGRATSYGIHPTNVPASIGSDQSRGCVRMRPPDAETIFRLAPIGTPVYIHS